MGLTGTGAIGTMRVMIIGVAGRNGAGKGELIQFLDRAQLLALSRSPMSMRQELARQRLCPRRGSA